MKKTAGEKAVAYYMANPGVSLRDAGRRFGISGERVRQVLGKMGLTTRPRATADAALEGVRDLDTKTPAQLAAETGFNVDSVARALRRRGISSSTRLDFCVNRASQMIQEARKGQKSLIELSIEFDMAYVTVARTLRSVGIATPYKRRRNGHAAEGSTLVDAEGISIYEAAKRVGCAPPTIRSYRIVRGLPVVGTGRRP